MALHLALGTSDGNAQIDNFIDCEADARANVRQAFQ